VRAPSSETSIGVRARKTTKTDDTAITLRLPPDLYAELTERAEAENRSINKEAIMLLREAMQVTPAKLEEMASRVQDLQRENAENRKMMAENRKMIADVRKMLAKRSSK
jgi:hypothetical protein